MITTGFLAQWALRSAILIVVGAVVLKVLRVKDPAVRLAAWTAMLCVSLAIPLLSISLPAMPVKTLSVVVSRPVERALTTHGPGTAVFAEAAPVPRSAKTFDWSHASVLAYLIVAGLLSLRLCFGLATAVLLLRRSWPTELPGVRESGRIASPVTLGVVRPSILLPTDWREWDTARLEGVLAHERSHIRRHDPAVQVLSAIHRTLLWYSPLSWYLDCQIVRLAEEASDDDAVAAIRDRESYAETLLEFMRGADRHANFQGVPMARYGQPERRIHRILDATALSRGVTRWTVAAILALAMPLAYVIAAAQERLTFEAASVKPWALPSGGGGGGGVSIMGKAPDGVRPDNRPTGGPGTTDPGRIHYPRVTAQFLLVQAYGVNDYQIAGPDWIDRQFFDIDATMAPGTTKEQFQAMLQNLLADRFKLATHREAKVFSGYALVVAKNGPKFKESAVVSTSHDDWAPDPPLKPGADGFFPAPQRPGMFLQLTGAPGMVGARSNFREFTMPSLATVLQKQLMRPVADETGLASKYDFVLNFSTQGLFMGHDRILFSMGNGDSDAQPDLASALQSQLGLKLEPKKVSQEVIVVDRMEKTPTGN